MAIPQVLLAMFGSVHMDMFMATVMQQLIAWPITLWVGIRWAKASFRVCCPLTRFPLRIAPTLLLLSFGVTILLLALSQSIPMPELLRTVLEREIGASSRVTLFLAAVIVAPLAEEFFFRGLVLRGYLARYSVKNAVCFSAALFAVFHLNPWQGIIALPLGLLCAWLVIRTGSLLPGILVHAMVNFSTNFLMWPLAHVLGFSVEEYSAMRIYPPRMLLIGAALSIGGGFILWRQLRPPKLAVVTEAVST